MTSPRHQQLSSSPEDLLAAVRCLGLIEPGERVTITPLAGGVSSDIAKVETANRVFVVKRALPKLRVSANWEAPVERNRYEVEWLKTVGEILPGAAPKVLASNSAKGLFAMEYCDPSLFTVWKGDLAAGKVETRIAAEVGLKLAAIHSHTAGDRRIATYFATDSIFHAIRLEPYLEATGEKHPALKSTLYGLAERTLHTNVALVHGDVSPKNILVGPAGPVFVDAECAWFGDPAFDLAFCLNHLLLKCIRNRAAASQFLEAFDALATNYLEHVNWEPRPAVESRAGALLPALFLARVDGKSPVEYITEEKDRELIRSTAVPFIVQPPDSPFALRESWRSRLA